MLIPSLGIIQMLTVLRFLLKTKNLLVVLTHKLRKRNVSFFSNNLLVICSPL